MSYKFLYIWMYIAKQDHARIVAMVSLIVTNNVDINIVSILKYIVIGDAMRHHVIY